jgi:uncharacterized protein (DUF305 family)
MDRQLTHHHYLMLGLNLLVSTIVMYFVMFPMNWSIGDVFNNLNMLYMALMMATPMGVLMLLMMRPMYPSDRLNLLLHAFFALVFIVAALGVRAQGLIGDQQFVRSMIPHHSGAILMCNRSSIQDAEIRDLCFGPNGIIESQTREIDQMKAILARL